IYFWPPLEGSLPENTAGRQPRLGGNPCPTKPVLVYVISNCPVRHCHPTRQFLAGISFGKAARVDAALVTITMPGVIRIFLNFDFRQPVLFPIAMLAAPCSSTNSLTKPTIP